MKKFGVLIILALACVVGLAPEVMAWSPSGGWNHWSDVDYKYGSYANDVNQDGRENLYRYVVNGGTRASMVGDPACIGLDSAPIRVSSTDTVSIGYTVDFPTTGNQNFVNGVWIESVAAGSAGWILVQGQGSIRCETAPAVGYRMVVDVGGSDFFEYGRPSGVQQCAGDSAAAGVAITSKFVFPMYMVVNTQASTSQTYGSDSYVVNGIVNCPRF